MSEISKARERILNRKAAGSQLDEREWGNATGGMTETAERRYPRKFTVSSLTHHLDHKASVELISPSQQSQQFSRNNTASVGLMYPPSPSAVSQSNRNYISRAKENTPMLKTINIKIQEVSKLSTPASMRHLESEMGEEESAYLDSPPRVQHRRPLHKEKIELILAAPQIRRHQSPFKPRECELSWAEEYISQQKRANRSYTDDFFPPERTIVFNRKILYQEEGLKFQRLSRIYHNDLSVVKSCEPTLLSIGKYTNPYIFSALSILAEDPPRVLSLFGNQQANEDGIYHINLCKDGVWRYILIDDFVPVKSVPGRKHLLFIHSREVEGDVEIWPALIQKAVAKVYGTYLDLAMVRGEGMADLFRLITGAPTTIYPLNKDFRSYLILIDAALKRKHIVTLEAIPEEHAQTAGLRTLTPHQAYKVLEIKKTGLKIRNYAQPELITKLTFEQCLIFSRLVIYRVESGYRYITQKLRHKKHFFSKVAISVPTKTRGYFQVWQNNPAYYKKHLGSNIDYTVSRVKMWLAKIDQQGERVQPAREIELAEGDYELHVHLCQPKEYDFTLSYYGERQISISRVKNMEEWYESCLCVPV